MKEILFFKNRLSPDIILSFSAKLIQQTVTDAILISSFILNIYLLRFFGVVTTSGPVFAAVQPTPHDHWNQLGKVPLLNQWSVQN